MAQKIILSSIAWLNRSLKIEATVGKYKITDVKYTEKILRHCESNIVRSFYSCISCAYYVITARNGAKLPVI